MNQGAVQSGLSNLPTELLRKIVREASISSTGLRLTSQQCKSYSDAFADTCSTKLTILTATAQNPHPAQDFARLDSFMSQQTGLTKLRLQTNFRPVNFQAALSAEAADAEDAEAKVQILELRDVLAARAPNTTKMSLLHTGHRSIADYGLYALFFSPFAANLTSLKLDVNGFFYTAAHFSPFTSLQLLEGNGVRHRVQTIDFLTALPTLRKFRICTQSTSSAAFAAMSQIECLSLKVVEADVWSVEALEGIEQLAAVVDLSIDYSAFFPPNNLAFLAPSTSPMLRISTLDTLRRLAITWEGVLDISSLSSLVNLEKFSLDCRWPTSLACVSNMLALTHLHLEGTQYEEAELPLDLSNNRMLQELVVRNRRVSPQEINSIAALPFLTRLDLCHCWCLSQERILPLAALTGLVFLRLSYTQVKKTVVRTLYNAMPKLKLLDVRCCNPKNRASFGKLPDLKERIPIRVFITDV